MAATQERSAEQLPERSDPEGNTSRAIAFSDGVFAIVITLLVLDVRPPQTPPGHLLQGLLAEWPTYLAYVTSYLYVGVVWLNHKWTFARVRRMDRGLHWANLGVLATTSLLPFPTAVLSLAVHQGNPADMRTAVGLYALIGAVLCVSWLVLFHYLATHPNLLAPDVRHDFFAQERKRAVIGVVLYLAAGVLGYLIGPPVAMAIFLVLPTFYAVTSRGLGELRSTVRRALPGW